LSVKNGLRSLHLKNIFKDGELEENSVTEDFSVTASDGKELLQNAGKITAKLAKQLSTLGTQLRFFH